MKKLIIFALVFIILFFSLTVSSSFSYKLYNDNSKGYPKDQYNALAANHNRDMFLSINMKNEKSATENPDQNIFVVKSFDGLHYGYNGLNADFWVPPDVQIAVSLNYIVEIVNVLGAVWDKNGNFLSYISLYSVFSIPNTESIGDPRIIYDPATDRFFMSVYDANLNSVLLAVSQTNNPMGNWYVYRLSATNNYFPDQPYIGINNYFVVVTANDFLGNFFEYSQYWILNKSQLLSGSTVEYYTTTDTNAASIRPAIHISSSNIFYMASTQTNLPNTLEIFAISGSLPNNLNIKKYFLTINSMSSNIQEAPQLGTTYTIDVGDNRIQDIFYQNGNIWLTAEDSCIPPGDSIIRDCIRTIQVNTSNMNVVQDFDISKQSYYFFYGAMRLIGNSFPVVIFGFSSQFNYPSLMLYYKQNNIQSFTSIKNGTGPEYTSCNSLGICRYGDYFSAVLDPANNNTVWVAGEYGRGSIGWGTYIAQVSTNFYIEVSYSVIGGGTGYSNPILTYYYQSVKRTAVITPQPVKYPADPNSQWYVNQSLLGSNSNERWITNQITNGTVNSSLVLHFYYYHQYHVLFNFTVIGGGKFIPPNVTFQEFGNRVSTISPSDAWVDSNSTYLYTNPLQNSNSEERWISKNYTGIITRPLTVNTIYYHQYLLQISLNFIGKPPKSSQIIYYTQFGINNSTTFNKIFINWFDAYTSWSISNPAIGSNSTERWISYQNTNSVIVTTYGLYNITFYHQYYVNITIIPTDAAKLNVKSGWFNENDKIIINVVPNNGWKFIKWIGEGSGSYNGTNQLIMLNVTSYIIEEAIFYAIVNIYSSTGLTITYSYLNHSGIIEENRNLTIYLPVNTTLNLAVNENTFLYTFNDWNGNFTSTNKNISVKITAPTILFANSSFNILLIGIIVAVIAIIVVIIALVILRKKAKQLS
jgi:hypothetical protein